MTWKIEESNEPNGLDGIWLSGLAGLKELFLGFKDELTPEEWSDIRLIAAAPDLLAVCKALLEIVDCGPRSGDGWYYSAMQEAMNEIRKIVAKAL